MTASAPLRAVGSSEPRANPSLLHAVLRGTADAARTFAFVGACLGGSQMLSHAVFAADAPANATVSAPETASAPAARTASAAPPVSAASGASGASATSTSTPGATTPPATQTAYGPSQSIRYGNPAVFRNLIPSPMLESQATGEFDEIARGAGHAGRLYPATDAHAKRIRTIIDQLVPFSLKWNERAKTWKWDVAVVKSPDIRMYCLPGGKVVVYGGLLDRVRLNDNELGMLLGHEIAHALREHARERLGEQQAAQLGSGPIPQLFGLADLGAAPLGIGTQLLEMKYESTDETEADVIGSDIASRAGFDPRAAITLWDKLAVSTRANRGQGFIYVHPYTPARRADIMKRLPDMLPLYAKAIGKTVDALPDYAGIGRPKRKFAAD